MEPLAVVPPLLAIGVWVIVDRWRPLTHKRQLVIVLAAVAVFVVMPVIIFLLWWVLVGESASGR